MVQENMWKKFIPEPSIVTLFFSSSVPFGSSLPVDAWFCVLGPEPTAPLPTAISGCLFAFLERATCRLLVSQHFQVLLKALCFVYMHIGRLPNALRLRMLRYRAAQR